MQKLIYEKNVTFKIKACNFYKNMVYCSGIEHIYPWLSWIARKTPTLEVAGSNPVG